MALPKNTDDKILSLVTKTKTTFSGRFFCTFAFYNFQEVIQQDRIFSISHSADFTTLTLEVFDWQYHHNAVYREFCDYLNKNPDNVSRINEIPFLPITFFKSKSIITGNGNPERIFTSSGTTGSEVSRHLVTDISVYENSFRKGFTYFYGNIKDYAVLALLPSYLERQGSSLIYMAEDMIRQSEHPSSGFYLHNLDELAETLSRLEEQNQPTILIGVSFALLDLIEKYQFDLKHTIVMETGGMKGRRKEMIRAELHEVLKIGFGVQHIHSEYGMTELLSQAYSKGNGVFDCPPWIQMLIRDTEDPLTILPDGKAGGINIIDLANINSCSFIATQDLGRKYPDGQFEVLGRFDDADIRGCNLLLL